MYCPITQSISVLPSKKVSIMLVCEEMYICQTESSVQESQSRRMKSKHFYFEYEFFCKSLIFTILALFPTSSLDIRDLQKSIGTVCEATLIKNVDIRR